jgi:hypothetical protein
MIFINFILIITKQPTMKNTDELLTNGYDFNMGKYMGDGWNLFKKGAGNYIGFTVVFFVIVMIMTVIPFINLLVSVFEYVLIAGIFIYSRNLINGKGEFSNFFEGFNSFGQIFLFLLVLLVFMIPALTILVVYLLPEGFVDSAMNGFSNAEYLAEEILSIFQDNMGGIMFLYLALFLYILYLYISYSFTLILIVDRNMKFWEAMELSRKVIAKNFFSFFGMYFILWLMLVVGVVVTCGLGLLVAIPYLNTVVFSAYDNIIGPEEDIMNKNLEEFGSGSDEPVTAK